MDNKYYNVFKKYNFYNGRCLGSKSGNRKNNPVDYFIFNANIAIYNEKSSKLEKIWFGDLNITKDYKILKEISEDIHQVLYIFHEMDGRFGNEDNISIERSVWNTTENKKTLIDIEPDNEFFYKNLLYWKNSIINKGFSINGVIKTKKIVENKYSWNRYNHYSNYNYIECVEDFFNNNNYDFNIYNLLDKTNIKNIKKYRNRRKVQKNIYYHIKNKTKLIDRYEEYSNIFDKIHTRKDLDGFKYKSFFKNLHWDRNLFLYQTNILFMCENIKVIYTLENYIKEKDENNR